MLVAHRRADYRLVPAAAAIWFATAVAVGWPRWSYLLVGIMAIFTLVATVAPTPGFQGTLLPPGVAAVLIGALLAGYFVGTAADYRYRADPATEIADQSTVRMRVKLLRQPRPIRSPWGSESASAKAKVETVSLAVGQEPQSSSVEVLLTGSQLLSGSRGDTFDITGKIDRQFAAAPPSIGTVSVTSMVPADQTTAWMKFSNRTQMQLMMVSAGIPLEGRGLIAGMSVGDDRLVPPDLREAMIITSLTHLTAVSGSHMAIVLALLMLVLPGGRYIRPAAMLLFVGTLVLVVGPEPSVLRAAGTALIVAGGLFSRRGATGISSLSAVVMVLVLLRPWLAVSFGFTLSALATWGILTTGRMWLGWVQYLCAAPEDSRTGLCGRTWRRAAKWLGSALAVTLAAQLWVLPVTVLINPWVPLYGLLANVLVAPAVAPITVLGLLAASTAGWAPQLASLLCQWAAPFAQWTAAVARTFVSWPGATLWWPSGPGGVLGGIGLIVAVTVVSRRIDKKYFQSAASN